MKQKILKNEIIFDEPKQIESMDNILDFPAKLEMLRKDANPGLIKKREGWRDREGSIQMADYIEWHTVADILDQTTPNWTHEVKHIGQIGKIVTVTVAITIDGITREGIGTGFAGSKIDIEKAEHDALKRAVVKFGVARELYKKEIFETEQGSVVLSGKMPECLSNPIAKSLSDLVTANQLGIIWLISRELGVDANDMSEKYMSCGVGELSKKAASSLISRLRQIQREYDSKKIEIRRAG